MLYLPELYYFFDQKDFPLEKATRVTASMVSSWCSFYEAKLISPVKGIKETIKKGKLPQDAGEKEKFINELLDWIFANSEVNDLFTLFLTDEERQFNNTNQITKFDHHDDTCCWVINLSEEEFNKLSKIWQDKGLPKDLFYKEGRQIQIQKSKSFVEKILTKVGFSKIYTPKQWEVEQSIKEK